MKKTEIANDLYTLAQLTKRDLKLFLKDKLNVFFSLLAPLIVFALYILFLGDTQLQAVNASIPEGVIIDQRLIRAFIDSWMLSGVLGVGCLTVSLQANCIMVQDKSKGILNDGISSPVKKSVIKLSYYVFNFVITFTIMFVIFLVCLIYLAAKNSWFMSAGDVFSLFGTLLLAIFSATLITVLIADLFKTEAALGAFSGITSAIIGFLLGAYIPMSIMPVGLQYVSALLPASHSVGMFKQFFVSGVLDEMSKTAPLQFIEGLKENYSVDLNFFGKYIQADIMSVYIACSIILFAAILLILNRKKTLTSNFVSKNKKKL